MIAGLGFLVQLVLLAVVLVAPFVVGVLVWDITVGPSAQMAKEHARRRAVEGVHGR